MSCCRNRAGTDSLDQRQECREALPNPRREWLGERNVLFLILEHFLARTVRLALKTSDRHEKAQHLGGKWIPGSQLFGSGNPPLAQVLRHGAIISPAASVRNATLQGT